MQNRLAELNRLISDIDNQLWQLVQKKRLYEEEKNTILSLDVHLSRSNDETSRIAPIQSHTLHSSENVLINESSMNEIEISTVVKPTVSSNPVSSRFKLNLVTEESPHDFNIYEAANRYWQITTFRPFQLDIIRSTMRGDDVMAILSTGAGKSLCFQLPAVLSDGLTIVISPLLSLIYDQVEDLQGRGIGAYCLTGDTPKEEQKEIISRLVPNSEIKLLYVTPEKIAKSKRFMQILEKLYRNNRLARIVVDEAHCASEYGHDFRPDYKNIGVLKKSFHTTPVIALTATCPSSILPGLLKILNLDEKKVLLYRGPLNRPNLFYQVISKPVSEKDTVALIGNWIMEKHLNDTGIIYCLTKKECDHLATALNEFEGGVLKCAVYHSDVSSRDKESIHRKWKEGSVRVVCATIAFGLGINHPHVRFVIHHSPSKSLEGYFQETGRAGRDGAASECLLLYRGQDFCRMSTFVYGEFGMSEKIPAMFRYCNTIGICRRTMFQDYFGRLDTEISIDEIVVCNNNCDSCSMGHSLIPINIAKNIYSIGKLLDALQCCDNLTFLKLVNAYRGRVGGLKPEARIEMSQLKDDAKNCIDSLFEYPCPKSVSDEDCERIVVHMLLSEFLDEKITHTAYGKNSYLKVSKQMRSWMRKCQVSGQLLTNNDSDNFYLSLHAIGNPISDLRLKGNSRKRRIVTEDDYSDELQIVETEHAMTDTDEDIVTYNNRRSVFSATLSLTHRSQKELVKIVDLDDDSEWEHEP